MSIGLANNLSITASGHQKRPHQAAFFDGVSAAKFTS
jgi:hypothetical protein